MRIAVSADAAHGLEAPVSPHFGRCPFYAIVDMEDGQVHSVQTVANPYYPEHTPGVIPQFIHSQGADVMLTGGMGYRAVTFFEQLGVQPVTGASGTVRQALDAFWHGQLSGAAPCHESTHGCGDEHGHGHGEGG
jgi:predicted Fe-Mo cluster-binding NifX family protein